MRWFWIDRFIEFESGRVARALKCITLGEDHFHDHFPHYLVMPHSLVIEGFAQTGGLLISEVNGFAHKVVLAKVARAKFHFDVVPGDCLTYQTVIQYVKDEGARVTATSYVDDRIHAEAEVIFAHVNDPRVQAMFEPGTHEKMMRLLGAYDVGHAADGSPLRPFSHKATLTETAQNLRGAEV